jgi:hypothetical protein
LLHVGDKLVMNCKPRDGELRSFEGTITVRGEIKLLGKTFLSPSHAAVQAAQAAGSDRTTDNGWIRWKTAGGDLIADLREQFLQRAQSGHDPNAREEGPAVATGPERFKFSMEAEETPDAYPANDGTESATVPGQEWKKTYEVTLQDLIAASLLSPPLRLFKQYKGKLLEAKLLPQGTVEFEGQTFNSCSSAAEFARSTVTGRMMSTNGWDFWQYLDAAGNTAMLSEAREKLLTNKRRDVW